MPVFEVWQYGDGDSPRNRYTAVSEDDALTAHLNRRLFTGNTYREHLQDHGLSRVMFCVKNPALKGTPQKPNYPSIYMIEDL